MSYSFHSSHLICLKEQFLQIAAFLTNICARSRQVTIKIGTLKEVNTRIGRKKLQVVSQ